MSDGDERDISELGAQGLLDKIVRLMICEEESSDLQSTLQSTAD